jgi:DNA mismatch repair protein PMS2
VAVLDFQLPADQFDVNVTPDKRKVFLQGEAAVLQRLELGLSELWEPSRSTYEVARAHRLRFQ